MKSLFIKWSISKARETYGWNICTLQDNDKKYKTNGGGYDMLGTVFAQWLWSNYKDVIISKILPLKQEFYGFYDMNGKQWIDDACGFDCMKKIAEAIGLTVRCFYQKGDLNNIVILEND